MANAAPYRVSEDSNEVLVALPRNEWSAVLRCIKNERKRYADLCTGAVDTRVEVFQKIDIELDKLSRRVVSHL